MSQDTEAVETKYSLFIEQVTATKLVWSLKNKGGWANSTWTKDEEVSVIPLWSDKAYAKACARDDWKGYLPVAIPLAEFLEGWCIEMFENGILAGINWDANMVGKEMDAASLALELLNRLKADNAAINFSGYDSIADLAEEISSMADDDDE